MSDRPPLRATPGPVLLTILSVVLVATTLGAAETWSRYVFGLVGVPVLWIGALARWRMPAYDSRLPRPAQAVLAAALVVVSASVIVDADARILPTAFIGVLAIPGLFPALLPAGLRDRWSRAAQDAGAHEPTGPTWQRRED